MNHLVIFDSLMYSKGIYCLRERGYLYRGKIITQRRANNREILLMAEDNNQMIPQPSKREMT